MLVSPTGYYAKSFDEALQLAQISAEVTHSHPEGIIGAQAVAACIFLLRNDEPQKIKDYLKKYCFYDMDQLRANWQAIQRDYSFDVTCQGSVPEAIFCALKNLDFPKGYEFTVREAVSLGGDADTQGAIAGGIAAAVSEVPEDILSECLDRLDPRLADVIESFNEVCNQRTI
jgi:ADP-ribosylglycohydrolase